MRGVKRFLGMVKVCVLLIVAIGLLAPFVILYIYSDRLGPVSGRPEDWSAFGAVLGGSFTLLGAAATTGTLMFLISQQRENGILAKRQLDAISFDQYINHRKVFIERLQALEFNFDGMIKFKSYDELYGRVFPLNRPTSMEYGVDLNRLSCRGDGLQAGLDKYNLLGDLVREVGKRRHGSCLDLVRAAQELQTFLGLSMNGDVAKCGDILFRDVNTGVNVYDLNISLQRLEYVLNSYLFYSGNETVKRLRGDRDSALNVFLYEEVVQARAHGFEIVRDDRGVLELLWGIYIGSRLVKSSDGKPLLREVCEKMESIFSSCTSVTEHTASIQLLKLLADFIDFHCEAARGILEGGTKEYDDLMRVVHNLRRYDKLLAGSMRLNV